MQETLVRRFHRAYNHTWTDLAVHCGNLLLRYALQNDGYWKLVGQLSKTSSANLKLQVSLYEHDWFMEAAFFLALHTGIRTRVPTPKLLQTVFFDAGSFIVMT